MSAKERSMSAKEKAVPKTSKEAWVAVKRAEEDLRKKTKKALNLERKEIKGGRAWINISVSTELKEALIMLKQHYSAKAEKKGKKFLYDDLFRCLVKQNPKTKRVLEELGIDL